MNNCFISHSTKDEIGTLFTEYLTSLGITSNHIFCSSNPENGIDASKQWFDAIFQNIRQSDVVFLIVSPNYMRSGISLLEAGAAFGVDTKVIILSFPNTDFSELTNIFHGHQIIDFLNEEKAKRELARAIKTNLLIELPTESIINNEFNEFLNRMKKHRVADINTPPISIKSEYTDILKPMMENGILKVSYEPIDMSEKLRNAKRIKIITTTGIGFFRYYISQDHKELEYALKNGCIIEILLGNPSGALFRDVELLENRPKGQLDEEFFQVLHLLSSIIKETNVENCGKIYVGNVGTSLRQTAILISDSEDGKATWGWNTVTLPPSRCNVHSMSFELVSVKDGMLKACETYFDETLKKAKSDNELFCLNDGMFDCFKYEGNYALSKWQELQKIAFDTMQEAEDLDNKKLLIECAAQHPLSPRGKPGKEFRTRLERAASIYKEYTEKGWLVKIYVPGSLHQFKNARGEYVSDSIALSESGKQYLIDCGIPKENIFADDANQKYKSEMGVYCSADECYVASRLFFDGEFQRIFCICSPSQSMKKALYYLLFSLSPTIISAVPNESSIQLFHQYPYEATVSIPEIISKMDNLQSDTSPKAIKLRKERNPNFKL